MPAMKGAQCMTSLIQTMRRGCSCHLCKVEGSHAALPVRPPDWVNHSAAEICSPA